MCGIAGFIDPTRSQAELVELCERQLQSIEQRGRSESAVTPLDSAAMGTTRLAIIDIQGGHQPMTSPDGRYTISYNGEVYNYRELTKELEGRGWSFTTSCDTEVVLAGFCLLGKDFISRLNGMFAFSIWDAKKKCFTLFRDRFGIKPLYYWMEKNRFAFASQIAAILKLPFVERGVNKDGLIAYLSSNYINAPQTIFEGIHQLEPGQFLRVNLNGEVEKNYWYEFLPTIDKGLTSIEIEERFTSLFEEAVKRQLVSDTPVGAFLSGGLDSTAIVSVMAKETSDTLNTYSVAFPEADYSEGPYAKKVANAVGAVHEEVCLNAKEWFSVFDETISYQDSPVADQATVALLALSKKAREKSRVVLVGDGGDELLAGYTTVIADKFQPMFSSLPQSLISLFKLALSIFPVSTGQVTWDYKIRAFLEGTKLSQEDAHASWRMVNNGSQLSDLLGDSIVRCRKEAFDAYRKAFAAIHGEYGFGKRAELADLKVWMIGNCFIRLDSMTMGANLEARVPFLDNDLVDFLLSVPFSQKTRGMSLKVILRNYLRRIKLPRDIVERKKVGLHVPIARWFKDQLKDELRDRLNSANLLLDSGYINRTCALQMLDEHVMGRSNNAFRLYGLLVLLSWSNRFLSAKGCSSGKLSS